MSKALQAMLVSLLVAGFHGNVESVMGKEPLLAETGWKRNDLAKQRFEIEGTGGRNNPLRRSLKAPFAGDELYVRYRLRYDAASIDTPEQGDGEFFVLWLDQAEGNDGSTHSARVPDIGIHVSKNENRFMARYSAGNQKFAAKLSGDRDFFLVARLQKSTPGRKQPFDRLDVWIDPTPQSISSPDITVSQPVAISQVRWIGFSTGAKTEAGDRIQVWDIALATTWDEIHGIPETIEPPVVAPVPPAPRTVHFAQHVLPILKSRCFECHAGKDATEDVRLDVLDEVLNRTAPRNAAGSRLYQLASEGEMPPGDERLGDKELAVLRAWIDEGLDWDEKLLPTPIPQTDHWAFQPIRRPAVPAVDNKQWTRTPVDNFIARRHEELGITQAPEAKQETLLRRMSLDLLGLPFVPGDESGDLPKPIDRMLANPAYGERWGRHWLDVARWAESNGHQHNRNRSFAWRYRDWVVDAFNSGKPYNEFLRAQIAGDELEPFRDENVVATGFLAAARYSGNELDKEIQRNDILVDIVNTTAKAFLGLTLECAQCHTHKFDPITIRDYYRLQAFFAKGQPVNVVSSKQSETARDLVGERWRIFDSVHARMVASKRRQGHPEPIYVIPRSVVKGMKPDERKRFNQLEQQIAGLNQSWAYYSPQFAGRPLVVAPQDMRWPLPRDPTVLRNMQTMLLIRGDVKSRGPEVRPGWPAVFGPSPERFDKPRTALADWMTGSDNPLTARVWVNRMWQWHFGRGLVETSGDFGTQGAEPSHPELLDYLASELIESGWDTRHIHRLIVDSATYRQSSQFSAANAKIDPGNLALWRWTPRRLEAEAIRDSILAVSGQLDGTRGGPSDDAKSERRSLYLKQRRDNLPHQQMLFDSANGIVSCSRRRVSTSALQPLWLMNSQFVQQAADKFATRSGNVETAIRLAFGREATPEELKTLSRLADEFGLKSACFAILNSSEFLYVP